MPKRPVHIEELIIKYARGGRLSKRQLVRLRQWQSQSEDHQALPEKFRDPDWLRDNLRRLENVPSDRMWDFIRDRIAVDIQNEPRRTPGHLRRVRQWAPYAAAVLLLVIGCWLMVNHSTDTTAAGEIPVPSIARAGRFLPGNHQVLLTLADGRVLPLDRVPDGKVAEMGDLILVKTDSIRLEFVVKAGGAETAINCRVTTGQTPPFHLVFPDGSTALLSYASSLSTSFHEGQREVALDGEALFETAKDSHHPFLVSTKKAQIQVLGTRFNVANYSDEAPGAISLFSGAIRVMHDHESKLLRPLQQAVIRNGQVEVRHMPDSADVLSWAGKDPFFRFDKTDLNSVIRRIARWHQLKVYNPDNVTGLPITGIFRQKESLEVTLGMIDHAESSVARLKRRGDTIEISAAMASR